MNKLILQVLIVITILVIVSCDSNGEDKVGGREHARFTVGTEIVNQGLKPFTATIGAIGNTLIRRGGGFEPTILRNRYISLKNSPDRVYAAPKAISHWDVLREGTLDNAEVFVYRIEDGQVKLVRKDRIQDGGHHASGWLPVKKNRLLQKNVREYRFNWEKWNRPGVKYYFTVRAVDRSGNLSPPAPHFSITSPSTLKNGTSNNPWIPFKPSKITLDRTPPPAPVNLRGRVDQAGKLLLQWDGPNSSDLAGYYVYRSDYHPEEHSGYYLQLESMPEDPRHYIKKGDLVVISKKFYGGSDRRYLTNRVWGDVKSNKLFEPALVRMLPDNELQVKWKLLPHESSARVEASGETYLRLNVATSKPVAIGVYNHSGTAQDWYDVLETRPYKIEVWLRKKGTGKVKFRMRGTYDKKPQKIPHIEFIPDEEWKKYTATFSPPVVHQGKVPNAMILEFSGAATFDIDNFRIFRADTGFLEYTDDEYNEVKQANIMALRTHSLIKTGINTYDIEQLTNSDGVISSTKRQNTLPQLLGIMKKAGVNPWLQIEPHLAPDEWRSLIEFIAAPYNPEKDDPLSMPWAYKRYMQGQMQPWTEEFDKIYFEIGNETWNRLFSPWTFTAMTDAVTGRRYSAGNVYGLFQEYVISLFRSSPYWNNTLENKFVFILGGHAWSNYGIKAADLSPSTDYMTIGGYNGGWDENEGPLGLGKESYFNVLNQVSQVAIPRADHHTVTIKKLNRGGRVKNLHIGTYEAGPGYAMNGLNNAKVSKQQAAEQELVMKSLASGTATLDSFLARSSLGFGIQNFFTLGPGAKWKSHAKWYAGSHAYPAWKLISLFNNHATGDMLRVETVSVPGVILDAHKKRMAVDSAPQVAVYATKNKDRVSVFVISRKIPDYPVNGDDGYTPVSIELPFRKAAAVTLFRMTGDFRSNNVADNKVKVEQVALSEDRFSDGLHLSSSTGADDRGVPPASTFLYVFDGISEFSE